LNLTINAKRKRILSMTPRGVHQSTLCAFLCLAALAASLTLSCTHAPPPRQPFSDVRTLAGANIDANAARFGDPFGIAVAGDGTAYVSDGETGRIWQIAPNGATKVVAENLNTPSAIAIAPDGTLVVADTGSHTIKRIDAQTGRVTIIAGVENKSGFANGSGVDALFNAPVGVTVGHDGTIYVADTYNDRIRAIDATGNVRTIAGGNEPGFADATSGAEARFDTPCGIAVETDGTLVVADTGNNRLRRVRLDGAVTTIAGTGVRNDSDGAPLDASFNEPTGVVITDGGTIFVTDAGGSNVRVCNFGLLPLVTTLAGRADMGLLDGTLEHARLNRPSGIAVSPDGTLLIADTGNKLVRAVVRGSDARGVQLTPEMIEALRPKASDFRAQAPPRWPYDPPDREREIAATFGEVRGEVGEGKEAWFHNGLDVPGGYGETARVVRSERITRPLAVEDVGGVREHIRFPTMGYVHLRIGRDKDDRAFADERFILRRDERGKVVGVRVRRGASFKAGEAIGTLNNQNHVHLIAGPTGSEFNALAALELPGVKDTVAPVIEKDGVHLFDSEWREFGATASSTEKRSATTDKRTTTPKTESPLIVRGDVRIVVRAYDQMDGNATRRRLGLYQLGYQILKADGSPAPGFAEPLTTISFESLPDESRAARIAYAEGSKANATGETIFAYIVTNTVRDRAATENFWHASALPDGDYLVRVFAADFFGNKTTRDVSVRVVAAK
jgi:sugar lactone lactonase YvrE